MEIAFERHATSKIRKADDLITVKSMGFRGEALASIASISKVEMISKKEGTDIAHKIVVEGGKTLEFTEAARSIGTTITVENLFYNTPVRYKFLKKDYTEAGYIEDVVTRIALVNKDVSIKLISNGKTVVQTNGNGDLKTLIYSIYGKDVAAEIIEVDYEYEGIRVTGVIGKPVIARANRSNQLFFLNGRYIKDKNLTAAADQAYKGMIPVGRYGFIVLNLEMDPKFVDVNVHPAKLEVRFEDETKVFKSIYHAIKSNMAKSELVANVEREDIEESLKVNSGIKLDNSTTKNEFNKNFEGVTLNSNFNNELNDRLNNSDSKKSGIAGLFQKIIKEPEETAEEISNNHLEEIFKYRQGLSSNDTKDENSFNMNSNISDIGTPINSYNSNNILNTDSWKNDSSDIPFNNNLDLKDKKEEIVKSINENEVSKKVTLGNTLISSETKELDVTAVNEAIKDATTEMNSVKLAEKELTQVIDSQKVKSDEMQETQKVVDLEKIDFVSSQETMVVNENLSVLPQNTIVLDETKESKEETRNEITEDFSKIAEKLVESKLGLDNTQMIDTAKIREALKEEKFDNNPEFDKMYKKTFGIDPFTVRKEKELEELEEQKINASNDFSYPSENMNVFEDKNEECPEISYKFLGIAFSTYIIIEIKNEMYIIDQHAAHERIMYEKVKANYYSKEERDEQFLLLPDVISLTHKDMIIARENKEMFEKAGFSFEEFGENTIKLTSVPSMCENLNTKQLFLDILDEIDTVAVTARQEKEDKFIATVACKAAVKAKMKLDEEEVKSLMAKLLELPNPFTCPHGRPTAIKMTKYDLERKFSRR